MRKREELVRKKGIAVRRNLSKKCEENISDGRSPDHGRGGDRF